MKNIHKLLVIGLAAILSWTACEKEETQVVLNPNATLTATLSSNTVVLLKDNVANDAISVNWTQPDFGFATGAAYTVFVDVKGNSFKKAKAIGAGTDLKKTFKVLELNNILISDFALPAGAAADLEFKVECLIGAATKYTSNILSAKVTPYVDKIDLSSPWGVVGSATPGGWNGPDLPMYKTSVANELVAYITLIAGDIKFRQNNDWAVNLGGPNGTLTANGANITVAAGTYKVTMNPVALTYKIEAFTWGIVGDATPNAWNGPDMPMRYDATVDLWRAEVTLKAGNIKFRQNNAWSVEYGGASGGLVAAGANIPVTAGTYLITADFKNLKYTITAYKPFGIVGDATPNGWNGPDTKFTYDLSTKKWVLNNVVLAAGAIKFRENDAWTINWGATGSVEPAPIVLGAATGMAAGGKNIGVTAGTWSFELDLDAATPTYKAAKK